MPDSLTHITWRDAQWLWLAAGPWLLWCLQLLLGRLRAGDYAELHLLPWVRARSVVYAHSRPWPQLRRYWRHVVLALACLLFAMAMAGPRIAIKVADYQQERQHDTQLLVVFDVSRSMTARDVAPSRLQRAKLELEDLLARQAHLRLGLLVYAARAHLMIPPTHDKAVLRHSIKALHHGLLPTEGSNLQQALEYAAKQFHPGQGARALLLLSDGELPGDEASLEAGLMDAVSALAKQGIVLYVMGVGTLAGAPLQSPQGGWLSHDNKAVVSSLQQDRLRRLARVGNGVYADVSDTDADWQQLYDDNIRYLRAAGAGQSAKEITQWQELFPWFLAPAVLLLIFAFWEPRTPSSNRVAGVWFCAVLVSMLLSTPPAQASSLAGQEQAFRAYANGAYQQARQAYARVAGFGGRMGEGSSAYRLGEYEQAAQLFTQAVLDADSDTQRARAIFNLANSRYRLEEFEAAAALYEEALRYDPADKAARVNLRLATASIKQVAGDDSGTAARPGRGPRSASLQNPADVGSAGVSLGEDGESESFAGSMAERQQSSGSVLLQQSRPVVERMTPVADPSWQYDITSPDRIVRQAQSLKSDNALLWKRIFEAQEDFPAPVASPRELPDTPPW